MADSIGGLVSDVAGGIGSAVESVGSGLGSLAGDIGGAIGSLGADVGQALGFGGGYTAPSFGGDITSAMGISPATVSGPISAGAGPGMSAISAAPSFDAASAADNFYLSSAAPSAGAIGSDIGTAGATDPFAFGAGGAGGSFVPGSPLAGAGGGTETFIPAAADAAGTAAGKLTTGEQFLQDPSLGNLGKMALANPGLLLSGGLLGLNALKSQKIPGLAPIQQQAGQLGAAGKQLSQPLLTGKLPAGAQAAVDEAVRSNQANVRSQFANMGLSGSTMESTALQEAALRGQELTFQIAQSMAQLGLQDTALSSDLLKTIMQAQLQNDNALSQSIANFATALAGGGPSVKLSLA